MVGGADVLMNSELLAQFFRKLGCESGIAVTDDFSGYAVMWEDVFCI